MVKASTRWVVERRGPGGVAAKACPTDPAPASGSLPQVTDERDPHRIAALYRAHGAQLVRFLQRRTGIDQAPDLLHRVFARFIALAPHQRAAISSTEAYLQRAARNMVQDEREAAHRHADALHLPLDEVCLTAPCQLAALEARDMLNRIERSIQMLKPRTREIFLAHRLDGYSYAEIAARTGLSVKTVEKHMSRAIAHIDRTLSRQ